ncbi:MAG: 3-deoxy-7-phosphoheptulonate synthase, partial [Verrucomicrobia bacterium]|nr:3-deoxy-7-phosphoheptulonate synthase [Verrucomicrobiota bacterium]
MQLPTPAQIKRDIPLTVPAHIASWRRVAIDILERRDPRLALIVGPCSIHDADAVYEYGLRLKALLPEIEHA